MSSRPGAGVRLALLAETDVQRQLTAVIDELKSVTARQSTDELRASMHYGE